MIVQTERGASLMKIRRTLGIDLGDMILLRATDTGETTRFVDEDRLLHGSYDGRVIYFAEGPNAGQQRRIPAKGGGIGYLTWGRSVNVAPQIGDEAELWNLHGIGFHPTTVNEHIRSAQSKAVEYARIPIASDVAATYSYDARTIPIPDGFRRITGLQWYHHRGEWKTVPRAPRPGAPGYWIDKATRTIEIEGIYRQQMDLQTYRILGSGREVIMEDEYDTTLAPAEWIVAEAGKTLLMSNLREGIDARFLQQKLAEYSRESEMKRGMAVGREMGDLV
jgi:hypothetical protein